MHGREILRRLRATRVVSVEVRPHANHIMVVLDMEGEKTKVFSHKYETIARKVLGLHPRTPLRLSDAAHHEVVRIRSAALQAMGNDPAWHTLVAARRAHSARGQITKRINQLAASAAAEGVTPDELAERVAAVAREATCRVVMEE